jgi:hypothetical protein
MSLQRQQRKLDRRGFLARTGLALLLLTAFSPLPAGQAATTERIVVDPNRGLALSGFDPVAYFTDGKPLVGRTDLELGFAGTVWRFRNEGNRAAFAANPEVYLPVFGGYDPLAVTRGVATPGHPQIWLITGERLYLFYNFGARTSFAAAPETIAAEAEKKWPDVLMTISP